MTDLLQAVYHYNSPQLGGFAGASKEMFSADPDFVMGKVMTWGLGVFGVREVTTYNKYQITNLLL